jgi:Nucleoside 2-deoxyribosyltransferase like
MTPILPPTPIPPDAQRPWVFLAGAIDQGRAEPWQDVVMQHLQDRPGMVLNPRREAWDATWRQELEDPRFAEQVTWELDALEAADAILCWLPAGSQAPISLLELGLHARRGRLVVGCPPGFHRHGNVQAVCRRWNIPMAASLTEALGLLDHVLPTPGSR